MRLLEFAKFILCGEDKRCLSNIKNTLTLEGHIFIGYIEGVGKLSRIVQSNQPDLIILDVGQNFRKMRDILEVIDDEISLAVLLLLERKDEEVKRFVWKTKTISYVFKPIQDEMAVPAVETALVNFKRTIKYETEIKKLNRSLENRKWVDKAKWIIMKRENISEAEAHSLLINKSREKRISLKEIAEAIILAQDI